jgi:eukaryotic-like serine/threonine-protein kinase
MGEPSESTYTPCQEVAALLLEGTPLPDGLRTHVGSCEGCGVLSDLPDLMKPKPAARREITTAKRRSYAIRGEIDKGGMGQVVEAEDLDLGREVAIKTMLASDPLQAARFQREARITARLQHPSIVPIYELGAADDELFLVMRRIPGKPLSQVLATKTTPTERLGLLPRLILACEAIAYAHGQGVVHRDLKPGNVMVGDFGETIVIDWGLAKVLGEGEVATPGAPAASAGPALTATGALMGTPAYMAPEQARGEDVDRRTDVYALGAILYEVVSGRPPHTGTSLVELLASIVTEPTPRAPEWVPEQLAWVIDHALEKEPEARYADAGELVADLRRFEAGQLVGSRRHSSGDKLAHWLRRRWIWVLVITLLGIAGAVTRCAVVDQRECQRALEECR